MICDLFSFLFDMKLTIQSFYHVFIDLWFHNNKLNLNQNTNINIKRFIYTKKNSYFMKTIAICNSDDVYCAICFDDLCFIFISTWYVGLNLQYWSILKWQAQLNHNLQSFPWRRYTFWCFKTFQGIWYLFHIIWSISKTWLSHH
jgi:hypothetical protein